jgi:hypothetical protein
VDLAVGAQRGAVGAEEDAGVVAAGWLFTPLVKRAEEEVDAQAGGQLGEAPAGWSVERLGGADLLGGRSEEVGVLGCGDEVGVEGGRPLDEAAGPEPVGLEIDVEVIWTTAARNIDPSGNGAGYWIKSRLWVA